MWHHIIETVTGKGSFVAGSNLEIIKLCKEHLQQAVDIAAQSGITYEEFQETLDLLYH